MGYPYKYGEAVVNRPAGHMVAILREKPPRRWPLIERPQLPGVVVLALSG
jgi:hypothetical protein